MRYLLDTNAISELAKPGADRAFMSWFARQVEPDLAISSLVAAEVHRGILRTISPAAQERLSRWFDAIIGDYFRGRILPVDLDVAIRWSEISERGRAAGTPLPVVDSLIAATAATHGLTVVTRNVRDFERCGVPVLNPWAA